MFFVVISISIYNFGIYLILVLSNCNAIQSTDCHVRYFNKLSKLSKLNHLPNVVNGSWFSRISCRILSQAEAGKYFELIINELT